MLNLYLNISILVISNSDNALFSDDKTRYVSAMTCWQVTGDPLPSPVCSGGLAAREYEQELPGGWDLCHI